MHRRIKQKIFFFNKYINENLIIFIIYISNLWIKSLHVKKKKNPKNSNKTNVNHSFKRIRNKIAKCKKYDIFQMKNPD